MRQGAIAAVLVVVALAPGPARGAGASPHSEDGAPHERLLRVIDDPSTRARWLLYQDSEHPGRPARLVSVPLEQGDAGRVSSPPKESDDRPRAPILHAGDRLTVEEHTPVADSILAAVALGQAAEGRELYVRLQIGGKVVRAVAEGPGRARLLRQSGALP